jgi:uncharacterized protein (DUF58 family)
LNTTVLDSGALLDAVRGVHWPTRRLTRSALHGGHRSRRAGSSPEFMDYRPYQQGDDPARIDWKLFARTERVAIRLAHDDSSLPTTVVVDASASMAFPPRTEAKWTLAAAVALGLCAVAHGDGDPVGIAVAGPEARALPPRGRRGTVANILRVLAESHPSGTAPLAPVVAALRTSRRIALVSDFLGDTDDVILRARELIAAGREVYAVHVVAREELDPGSLGVVIDPEDAAMRRPLGESELAEYGAAFARWREEVARRWHDAGAVYQLATTGDAPERIVRRVVTPAVPPAGAA